MHFKVYSADLFATLRNIKLHTMLGLFRHRSEPRHFCLRNDGKIRLGQHRGVQRLLPPSLKDNEVDGGADLDGGLQPERRPRLPGPGIGGLIDTGLGEGLIKEDAGAFGFGL